MKNICIIVFSLIVFSCGNKSHTQDEYEYLKQEVTQLENECSHYKSRITYPDITEWDVLSLEENVSLIKESLEDDERNFNHYASQIETEAFFMSSNTFITDDDIKETVDKVNSIGSYLTSCSNSFNLIIE